MTICEESLTGADRPHPGPPGGPDRADNGGMLAPVPLHFGPLHPVEHLLVLLIAFGPFVVLGVVVAVQRRRAIAEEEAGQSPDRSGEVH